MGEEGERQEIIEPEELETDFETIRKTIHTNLLVDIQTTIDQTKQTILDLRGVTDDRQVAERTAAESTLLAAYQRKVLLEDAVGLRYTAAMHKSSQAGRNRTHKPSGINQIEGTLPDGNSIKVRRTLIGSPTENPRVTVIVDEIYGGTVGGKRKDDGRNLKAGEGRDIFDRYEKVLNEINVATNRQIDQNKKTNWNKRIAAGLLGPKR